MAKPKTADPHLARRYRLIGLDEGFRSAYVSGRTYDLEALTDEDAQALLDGGHIEVIEAQPAES
jgi:hypothetical protein